MALSPSLAPLASAPRWLHWKLIPDPERPSKPRKVPINPRTGIACNPTDPAAWCTYQEAADLAARTGLALAYVFHEGDGYFFLDIDNCRQADGSWTQLALSLVAAFQGHAACEVSQSGSGLHIFGWASAIPDHACRNIPLGLELYHTGRFVALTDAGTSGMIDADCSDALARVVASFFPRTSASRDVTDWTDTGQGGEGATADDEELIRIMMASGKNTAAATFNPDHVCFEDLWTANEEKLAAKWPSQGGDCAYDRSAADSALASLIAYWTAKNCERTERLMRRSALARDKWDSRPDYMERTILGACATVRNLARPRDIPQALTVGATSMTPGAALAPLSPPPPSPGLMATVGAGDAPSAPVVAPLSARAGVGIMSASEQQRFFAGCCYVLDLNKVWVRADGTFQDKARFEVTHGGCDFITRADGGKSEKSAWEAFTRNQCFAPPLALSSCFRPEMESGLITEDGLLNTYVPVNTPQMEGDASKWLTHLAKLFPHEDDRAIVTSWMAATVRSPGAKHQWAMVIQGCEGNGKTLLNTVMEFAVGQRYTHFARAASLAKTGMQFNKWIQGNLYICFEEINVGDKRDFLEEIKDIITNQRIAIEGKGADQTNGDNRANILMFTNHRGAVPITKGNRRYAIFYCPQQDEKDLVPWGMDEAYFADLWDWIRGRNAYAHLGMDGGLKIVNHWLHHVANVDERYDPRGRCQRAPRTSSTDAALLESLGTVEQEVLEAVESEAPGFAGGWICGWHLDQLLSGQRLRMSHAKRKAMLATLGFVAHPGLPEGRCVVPLEGLGKRPRLYVREGHLSLQLSTPKAVQEAYEHAQARALKRPASGLAA